jgi:mannose-P-dolichol utilization defect protein 1
MGALSALVGRAARGGGGGEVAAAGKGGGAAARERHGTGGARGGEPEREPAAATRERHSAGAARREGARAGGGEPEREPAAATAPSPSAEQAEAEEARRRSRARKAEALKRAALEEGTEGERVEAEQRSSRRESKRVDRTGEPLSVTLWVYVLLSLVLADRFVRLVLRRADPALLARALGVVLIVAALGVKVPQIAALVQSRTAEGLSPLGLYAATESLMLACVFHAFSRSPFTAWGDALAVLLQDVSLVLLLWHYAKTPAPVRAALGAAFAASCAVAVQAARTARPGQLWPLLALSTALSLSGALLQVVHNEHNKHTGASSFTTQLLLTLGALVRVFTTTQEVPGPAALLSAVLSALVQTVLLLQILFYWGNTARVLRREQRKQARP